MIVISGALVLVALVLLVIGLVSTALGFVYASIAVSAVSFVFLIVGIIQRRGQQTPDAVPAASTAAAATSEVEGVTTVTPSVSRAKTSSDSQSAVTGSVLVVAGRPRYHVEGCRYLTGKDADAIAVGKARAEGFTACGVCKPDDTLTAAPAAAPAAATSGSAKVLTAADLVAAERLAASTAKAPAKRAAQKAPAKRAAAKAPARAAAKKAPATKPVATKAPTKKAAATKAPTRKAAATKAPAKKAPAKKAVSKAPAKKAPAKKSSR